MKLIALVEELARDLEAAQVSFGHGTTNAFDEAAWLVLWRLGLPLDEHVRQQRKDSLLKHKSTETESETGRSFFLLDPKI